MQGQLGTSVKFYQLRQPLDSNCNLRLMSDQLRFAANGKRMIPNIKSWYYIICQ